MKTVQVKDAQVQPNPHGVETKKLYDTENAQVIHLTLKPGEQLKRHLTPVDVFFFVLEGQGIVEIGDEKKEVGPNTLIDSPAKIPHCWYNKSDKNLRVLITKVPRPAEATTLL